MDPSPLILVFVAIAALAAVRFVVGRLRRLDGEAIEMVRVKRSDFESGLLPAVCVKSGVATESVMSIPLRRRRAWGSVPVSPEVARRHRRWSRARTWARLVIAACLVAMVVVGSSADVTGSVLTIVRSLQWVAGAAIVVWWLLPLVTERLVVDATVADRNAEIDGSIVVLRGVHPRFAEAVLATRPRPNGARR